MSWPIVITDANDARVEPYFNIRDRDLAGRRGLFVAEGSVVLRRLVASRRFAAQSVLILENRLLGLQDVVEQMEVRRTPVYVANRAVIDAIAGFPMHRGVLGIGAPLVKSSVEQLLSELPDDAIVIVCIGIANHDNMGAIFRNAMGLGASAVVYDASCCDPFYRKAIRVSVGSVFDLPGSRVTDIDALRHQLDEFGFRQIALSPSGKTEIGEVRRSGRIALYLGAEGPGLPEELLANLESVRINMASGFDSLNVAAASAIALHSLRGVRPSS